MELALALAGDREADSLAFLPANFRVLAQSGNDFAADIAAAAAEFLDRGTPVVIVDSDSPTLPLSYIEAAIATLRDRRADVVVGPAEDGGYYLIGLAAPAPELFRDIPWSSAAVLATTLDRASAAGLSVHQLPTWWDVDTPADLARLRQTLLEGWWPHHTANWLRDHAPRERVVTGIAEAELWSAPWRRLEGRAAYSSPFLAVREDRVLMPDGNQTLYNVIETGECVGMLPFVDADTLLMVRQYRYVAGKVMLEMPTGGVHRGEEVEAAAHRELAEEAKVSAGRLEYLGRYHSNKSTMDETAHLYAAYELSPAVATSGDDTEFIATEEISFARVLELVDDGEILDSMTIMALLFEARRRAG